MSGRAVVASLLREGHAVRTFDRSASAWESWADIFGVKPTEAEHVYGDITSERAVLAAVAGCDAIIHTAVVFPTHANAAMPDYKAGQNYNADAAAAAAAGADDTHRDDIAWLVNLKGLFNVLTAAKVHKVHRVVVLGSCQTERADGVFFSADTRRIDASVYATTKRLQEEMCLQQHQAHGTRIAILRPDYIVDGPLGIGRFRESLPGEYCGTDGWVCRHDLADAARLALSNGGDYEVLHCVSSTAPGRRAAEEVCNVQRTREILGWQPKADLDRFRGNVSAAGAGAGAGAGVAGNPIAFASDALQARPATAQPQWWG